MSRLLFRTLAAIGLAASTAAAHAGTLTYNGYSVLNNQNVQVIDTDLGLNETGGSGQITLQNANTPTGSFSSWCIDLQDWLQASGQFSTGGFLDGALGDTVNALLTNATPLLSTNTDASSALQVAIWRAKDGADLTVVAPDAVSALADQFLANVASGTWQADADMRVAVLSGDGVNQTQAALALPEPASLAMLGLGLGALLLVTRVTDRKS